MGCGMLIGKKSNTCGKCPKGVWEESVSTSNEGNSQVKTKLLRVSLHGMISEQRCLQELLSAVFTGELGAHTSTALGLQLEAEWKSN